MVASARNGNHRCLRAIHTTVKVVALQRQRRSSIVRRNLSMRFSGEPTFQALAPLRQAEANRPINGAGE